MIDIQSFPWAEWLHSLSIIGLRGLVVLAAGLGALAVLRHRLSSSARHLILTTIIAGSLALPALTWILPAVDAPIRGIQSQPAPTVQPVAVLPFPARARARSAAAPHPARIAGPETLLPEIAEAKPATKRLPVSAWLLALWAMGVGCCLMYNLRSLVVLGGVRRRSVRECGSDLGESVTRLARECGVRRPITVLQARDDATILAPVTWGWRRPMLLVPSADVLSQWPEQRLAAVLRHELAHIGRADWLTQQLASVACALYWFNPLVWTVARAMQRESEQACDDQVVMSGTDRTDYAAHILELVHLMKRAQQSARMTASAQAIARPGSAANTRIRAILQGDRNRRPVSRRAALGAAAVAVALVIPAAIVRPAAQATVRAAVRRGNTASHSVREAQNLDFRHGLDGWGHSANGVDGDPNPYYTVGIDPVVERNGIQCAYLQSTVQKPEGYGCLRQDVQPKALRGKRIRMSGYVRTEGVRESCAPLLSLITDTQVNTWAMDNHPLRGSTDWRKYQYVVDVPRDCRLIMLGASLKGPGKVWASEFSLDVVGAEVPVTTERPLMMPAADTYGPESPMSEPTNMDFSNGEVGWFEIHEASNGGSGTPDSIKSHPERDGEPGSVV